MFDRSSSSIRRALPSARPATWTRPLGDAHDDLGVGDRAREAADLHALERAAAHEGEVERVADAARGGSSVPRQGAAQARRQPARRVVARRAGSGRSAARAQHGAGQALRLGAAAATATGTKDSPRRSSIHVLVVAQPSASTATQAERVEHGRATAGGAAAPRRCAPAPTTRARPRCASRAGGGARRRSACARSSAAPSTCPLTR